MTPTSLAAGPGNTYFAGNFQAERCWAFGTCTPCDPENPDVWCTPSVSPCCDTSPLGRLAVFTLPEGDTEPAWRIAHIFEGEQIANLASARDGTLVVATLRERYYGALHRYDPVSRVATRVRDYDAPVFSVTQDRRNGDIYIEVQTAPRIRRLWEDGTERPLPPSVASDPAGDGVLQYGPDGRLYRLVGRTSSAATLGVYELPLWARAGEICGEQIRCEAPATCVDALCVE